MNEPLLNPREMILRAAAKMVVAACREVHNERSMQVEGDAVSSAAMAEFVCAVDAALSQQPTLEPAPGELRMIPDPAGGGGVMYEVTAECAERYLWLRDHADPDAGDGTFVSQYGVTNDWGKELRPHVRGPALDAVVDAGRAETQRSSNADGSGEKREVGKPESL